jgi:hypothetical protein
MASTANSISSRKWEPIALVILFLIVAISRFKFWEITFWEWDEFLYAEALRQFNVWEHRPPPPGSIGFVAVTRGFNHFLHSDLKALVFPNVLFGSLLVFPLYFFYRYLSSRRVALLATLLTLSNAVVWYFSETGFADVTALFWVTVSLALLYRYEDNRSFYMGMLTLGVAIGIRHQNVTFGILLVPVLLWLKWRRGEMKAATVGLALLAAVCLVWFVPLVQSAGGLSSYVKLLRLQGEQTAEGDTGYLNVRHQMSLYYFLKIKFALMWGSRPFAIWLMRLTALGMAVYLWRGHRKAFLLLMLGFLPWILVDILQVNMNYPKYSMSTVVLVSFFVVYGLLELWPRFAVWHKLLAPATVLGLALFSVHWTLPVVRHLHTVKSPPVQLFDYIREHLNPKTDVVVADPQVRILPPYFRLPNFVFISQYDLDKSKIEAIQNMNWYYIGTSTSSFVPQVKFYADDRIQQFGATLFKLELARTDVLYPNDYDWKPLAGGIYWYLYYPEARCFLKNNGRAKVLSLESSLLPPGEHALPMRLELDGRPLLETEIPPHGWLSPIFLLKEPRVGLISTLTIKSSPPRPEDALVINAVHWLDVEPASVPETQVIDFTAGDKPLLLSGWSEPDNDGQVTFTWSNNRVSTLGVRLRPRGIYELSFRAHPAVNAQEPSQRQAVTICLDDICSPELELVNAGWQTYTRLIIAPPKRVDENAVLSFRYRFTSQPPHGGEHPDIRALGVAFDYVKLTWLGTDLSKTSHYK